MIYFTPWPMFLKPSDSFLVVSHLPLGSQSPLKGGRGLSSTWPSWVRFLLCPRPRPASWAPPRSRSAPVSSQRPTASSLVLGDDTVFISPPRTVLFSTVRKPWADVIPCGYEMQHTLRDLVPLKAFLLAGTTVTIVEEKVGFSVVDTLPPKPPFPALHRGVCSPAPLSAWPVHLSRKIPVSPNLARVHLKPPCCPLDSLLASGGTSRRNSSACQERKRGKGQERGERQEGKGRERQGSERREGDRQGTAGPGVRGWGLGHGPARPVTLLASPSRSRRGLLRPARLEGQPGGVVGRGSLLLRT